MAKKRVNNIDALVFKIEADFRVMAAHAETVIALSEMRNQVGALLARTTNLRNKLCHQAGAEEALKKLVYVENGLKRLRNKIREALNQSCSGQPSQKRKTKQSSN